MGDILEKEISTANGINLNIQKITKKHKNVAGIYLIHNIINNKCYIGQSINIYYRFSRHKWELKNNNHFNHYLQRSYNKYGLKCFNGYILKIIENPNEENLNESELYYIKLFQSRISLYGYNLNLDTHSRDNENISKNIGKVYPTLRKPVVQLDLNGNYINRYDSLVIAENTTYISRVYIGLCCRKLARTAGNYIWLYENDYNNCDFNFDLWVNELPNINRNNPNYSQEKRNIVIQMSKDGTIIKEWDYPAQTKSYGFNPDGVYSCCKGISKTYKGFIWFYKTNIK